MNIVSASRPLRTALLAAICFAAPLAQAIPLDFDVNGFARYDPASQANNDADVTTAVNGLITWHNGGTNPNGGVITFVLDPGSGVPAALPGPVTFGYKDENGPFDDVNPADYSYLLGKYANVAYVFYIGNLAPGSYSLPTIMGGHDLSHQVAFSAPRISVPDGGTTMALLGLSLLCVEAMRRRLKRA